MPDRPLSPDALKAYADPAYLSRSASDPQTTPDRGHFRIVGLPALIGGNAADVVTTLQALHHGGTHEANPLLGDSSGQIALTKAATTAGTAWALDHLAKSHKTAALIAALIGGAIPAAVAVKNAQQGR